MNNVAGLILAAGASSRMGSPKALLKIEDKTLLEDQVDRLRHADCDPVIAVVGSEANKIIDQHKNLNVTWALNHEWERGHFSSILCGLEELSSSNIKTSSSDSKSPSSSNLIGGSILLPIDTVGVPIETIKEILDKGLQEDKIIIPTFKNRGGHPVFLTTEFIKHLLASTTPNDRLDHLLKNDRNMLRLEVNSESILNNINTSAELKTYLQPPN